MNSTPIPPDSKLEQPTNAGESNEPKVQVTEADTDCRHAFLRAYFTTKTTLVECDRVIARHRTSAVEAARAEWVLKKHNGIFDAAELEQQRDQLQAELVTRRKEHDAIVGSLQAELSRVREELRIAKMLRAETINSTEWLATLDKPCRILCRSVGNGGW